MPKVLVGSPAVGEADDKKGAPPRTPSPSGNVRIGEMRRQPQSNEHTRLEHDALGPVPVTLNRLWGAVHGALPLALCDR